MEDFCNFIRIALRAVAMAASDGNRCAGGVNARAGDVAAGDPVAQREDGVTRSGAHIAHGGKARHQRFLCEARAGDRVVGVRHFHALQPRPRIVLAENMHMAVDQARQHEHVLEVVDRNGVIAVGANGVGGEKAACDAFHNAVLNDDGLVLRHRAAGNGEQASGVNDSIVSGLCGNRQKGEGERQQSFHLEFLE